MLKGPWGSGKTWFIEQQLKLLPGDQKTLYVSLFGVSSKAEIEDQFFEQLHPILAHKGTRVAGKILKGALKATLKFDWDGDGKSDGSVAVGAPELNVADLLKNSKGGLNLIFDDVERCEIPIPQLFGYVNYFVEHDQTRVVLLANEDEIIAKERKTAAAVNQTKEEIQYTFELRSGALVADQIRTLDSWLALMKDDSKDVARELRRKYPMLEALDSVFPSELWAEMMDSGLLDGEAIRAAVKQSKFHAEEGDRPDWLQLWDAFNMEDQALNDLLAKTEARLRNREYTVLGELMHVTGALISLASIGVYGSPPNQTVKLALANVNELGAKGQLLPGENDELTRDSWAGRVFHGADSSEFRAFQAAVRKKQAHAKVASYPDKAAELLGVLKKRDTAAFASFIAWSRNGDGRFAREPVLGAMASGDFVEAVETLSGNELAQVALAIQQRYEVNRTELASEKKWLNAVGKLLTPWTRKKGTMSGFYLRVLRDKVKKAAESLPKKDSKKGPSSESVAS